MCNSSDMHDGAGGLGTDANALYRVGKVFHDEQQNGISVQLSIDQCDGRASSALVAVGMLGAKCTGGG